MHYRGCGGPCVVVILADLEQADAYPYAVNEVVAAGTVARFGNAILGRIGVVLYDAVLAEIIIRAGKGQSVILLDLERAALNGLAVLAEVVVVHIAVVKNDPDKTGERDVLAVLNIVDLAVRIVADPVLARASELRRIGRVAGDSGHLGRPTRERVGVTGGFSLCRIRMGRRLAVSDGGRIDHRAVVVLPRYGVGVGRLSVRCRVDRVAGDIDNLGSPTAESVGVLRVSRLGGSLAIIGGHRAVRYVIVGLEHRAVVVQPCYGVGVDRLGVRRRIGHIAGDFGNCGSPTHKGVGELRGRGLGGSLAIIAGRRAVGNVLVGLKHRAVVVLPRYGVGVGRLSVRRRIGNIAGDFGNCGSPTHKGVGELRGRGLGGSLAIIAGRRAVGNVLVGLEHRAVVVDPRYGVGVDRLGVRRRIGHIAGDGGNLGSPAVEGVGVLRVSGLFWSRAVIGRRRAVGNVHVGLEHRAVVVDPRYGIRPKCRSESRGIGHIAGDSGYLRSPTAESVGILRVALLGGRCAVVHRHRAVKNVHIGFEDRAVVVLPRYGIGVGRLSVRCRVDRVAGDIDNRGRPTVERIGILSVARLGGRCAVVLRRRAVRYICVGLEHRAVLVLPRYGVLVDRLRERCRVGRVAGDIDNLGSPTAESVGILRVARLRGSFTVVSGRRAVRYVLVGFEDRAVSILPRYGEGRGLIIAPMVRVIMNRCVCGYAGSFGICGIVIIGILQLCGGDGNRSRTAANILICDCCCSRAAYLVVYTRSPAGADSCSSLGSVYKPLCFKRSVYINNNVLDIC